MSRDGRNREDCSPATSKACLKAIEAWHISGHFQVHIIESIITFIALISASLVLRLTFRASPQWRDLAAFSLLAGLARCRGRAGHLDERSPHFDGRLMLGGRKGVKIDSFSSAWHGSSVIRRWPGQLR